MNQEEFDRNELQRLIEELWDGTLSPANFQRLQVLLLQSDQACREYFRTVDLGCDLREYFHGETTQFPIANRLSSSSLAPQSSLGWGVLSLRRAVRYGVAAGVLIAVGWSCATFMRTGRELASSPAEAALSDVRWVADANARLFDQALPPAGNRIAFGKDFHLTHGLASLQFPAGATAILEAPSIFHVVENDRLFVTTGRCSVHAPPGAQGFRVDTMSARIVDLGTRFRIDTNLSGMTEVAVIEGEAELKGDNIGEATDGALRLKAQQAFRQTRGMESVGVMIDYSPDGYLVALPDRVVSYEAEVADDGKADLLNAVTVQRGGEIIRYEVDDLIGFDVVHFVETETSSVDMTTRVVEPSQLRDLSTSELRRGLLDRDRSLCSGLVNPGGSTTPLTSDPLLSPLGAVEPGTPGIGIRFHQPIINGPGPDVILFEMQSPIYPPEGDGFHVSPLKFRPGLKTHTIEVFDITMHSPAALAISDFYLFHFLREDAFPRAVEHVSVANASIHSGSRALAVGIDLSDLGYGEADAVDGLFFQDILDDEFQFDPVFIGGLPHQR